MEFLQTVNKLVFPKGNDVISDQFCNVYKSDKVPDLKLRKKWKQYKEENFR